MSSRELGPGGGCWLDIFGSVRVSFVSASEWGYGGFLLSGGKLGPIKLAFGGGELAN